ncbi:MAG: hypothetical protein NT067_01755 [Candidatus Diapherotrites archaeon]|nr:hypothetical protein [Candidatus Diapherotrites archaeon]
MIELADISQGLGDTLSLAFQKLGESFALNFVNLVGILILLAIGYFIGFILKKIVIKIVESLRFDEWLEEQNLSSAIGSKTVASVAGSIVKWSVIALFLAQGVELFKLTVFQATLEKIVLVFIPNLILAFIICIAGLIIGRYARNLIEASLTKFRKMVGFGVELMVIYMAAVIALQQIGMPTQILIDAFRIGFGGFMLMIAVAVGIAFGLAGVDDAKKMIKEIQKSKPQ